MLARPLLIGSQLRSHPRLLLFGSRLRSHRPRPGNSSRCSAASQGLGPRGLILLHFRPGTTPSAQTRPTHAPGVVLVAGALLSPCCGGAIDKCVLHARRRNIRMLRLRHRPTYRCGVRPGTREGSRSRKMMVLGGRCRRSRGLAPAAATATRSWPLEVFARYVETKRLASCYHSVGTNGLTLGLLGPWHVLLLSSSIEGRAF